MHERDDAFLRKLLDLGLSILLPVFEVRVAEGAEWPARPDSQLDPGVIVCFDNSVSMLVSIVTS